jgi:hypothetical protein
LAYNKEFFWKIKNLDAFLGSSLVDMYAKCGGRKIFN